MMMMSAITGRRIAIVTTNLQLTNHLNNSKIIIFSEKMSKSYQKIDFIRKMQPPRILSVRENKLRKINGISMKSKLICYVIYYM